MQRVIVAVTIMILLTVMVGTASAHDHQICTPGTGDPVLSQEPFHGTDPTNGAIRNNPNVEGLYTESHGLHPFHYFVHMGPSSDNRNVDVVVVGKGTCE